MHVQKDLNTGFWQTWGKSFRNYSGHITTAGSSAKTKTMILAYSLHRLEDLIEDTQKGFDLTKLHQTTKTT